MHEGKGEIAVLTEACRSFDAELAAYLEGEDRPELVAHARQCAFCHSVLADVEAIRLAGRDLALEEPPARIWASVRATLVAEGIIRDPQTFWQRWQTNWRAPAWLHSPVAVAALVCLTVVGISLLRGPTASRFHQPAAPSSASIVDLGDAGGLVDSLGRMETSYQARSVSFEPSVKATYQRSLESLDGEIRQCLDTVKQQPSDSLAQEYLLAAYEQKARVLQTALEFDGH